MYNQITTCIFCYLPVATFSLTTINTAHDVTCGLSHIATYGVSLTVGDNASFLDLVCIFIKVI